MRLEKLINRLRFHLAGVTRGPRMLHEISDFALDLFLKHNRVIGWEDGLPVHTLVMPADYSKAFSRSVARLLHGQRFARQYPLVATLSVTGDCDCTCSHCYAHVDKGKDLPTEVWTRIVEESLELGVFNVSFTGGEPLLREDLPSIIRAIDKDKAIGLVYTNGSLLRDRARELYGAGLRRVMTSIDYDNEKAHDAHRGRKGLFKQAVSGILEAKRLGMLTGIAIVATPERLYEGAVEGVLRLGTELNVNEIAIFGALPSGRLESSTSIRNPPPQYEQDLRELIQNWRRKDSGPGIWSYDHVRSYHGIGCAAGMSTFCVSNSGNFRPCEGVNLAVGSALDTDLFTLWTKLNALALERRKESILCWVCNPPAADIVDAVSPEAVACSCTVATGAGKTIHAS